MTLRRLPDRFLIYAPTLSYFFSRQPIQNTMNALPSAPRSKEYHVAMETYHELIQLYRKLLALTKFLVSMPLNIRLPHHRKHKIIPAQLNVIFIVNFQSVLPYKRSSVLSR